MNMINNLKSENINPKILIIDDEPDILKTLDNILTQEGYRVKAHQEVKRPLNFSRPNISSW